MHVPRMTIALVAGSGVLFCIDQLLKYIARSNPDRAYYLVQPWLGWEYFANTGIAFSLPFPQLVLIGITPLLLLWFFHLLRKHIASPTMVVSITLVLFGALSNFIDRMLFGITVDYLRIINGIINIADIMIATGIILIIKYELIDQRQLNRERI